MCAPLTVEDLIRVCGSIENAEKQLGKAMVQAVVAHQEWLDAHRAARVAARKFTPASLNPLVNALARDVAAEKALNDGWPDDADIAEFYDQHSLITR